MIYADYCVDGGLYRQAEIRGIKTCRQTDIHLTRWATWRWRLLAQAGNANHISRVYRELHEKIRCQAIKDGRLENSRVVDAYYRTVATMAGWKPIDFTTGT